MTRPPFAGDDPLPPAPVEPGATFDTAASDPASDPDPALEPTTPQEA